MLSLQLITNYFKKIFMGKEKKFSILTNFFIFYKSGGKNFLKLIVNYCLKDTY